MCCQPAVPRRLGHNSGVIRHSRNDPVQKLSPATPALTLVLVLALSGCGRSDDEARSTVRVFTYAGSTHCSPGSGATLAQMAAPLKDAGVQVVSAACGKDGLLHAAKCGANDGRIGVFEIAVKDAKKADSLNYAKAGTLPDLSVGECR